MLAPQPAAAPKTASLPVTVTLCGFAGRISRKVKVPVPDEEGRRDILGVHMRNTPMESREDKIEACVRIAKVTQGVRCGCV